MAVTRTSLVAGLLLGWAMAATGQAQPVSPLLRQIGHGRGWFRYSISGGKLAIGPENLNNFPIVQNMRNGPQGQQVQEEQLSTGNDNGRPSLNYRRTSTDEELTIEIAPNRQVRFQRLPRGESKVVPVEFLQDAEAKATLRIGAGAEQRVLASPGIWQLIIAHPKECQQHLFPLLEMLRPGWKLAEAAAEAEKALLRLAETTAPPDHASRAAMVKQLGDDSFTKREAADRALRAGGRSVVEYLKQLDLDRLDAEQQFRVRRIIRSLSQRDEESAEQIASALLDDRFVWLVFLERPEVATRQLAARRLADLLGGPVAVDPAADPATQKEQREQLRTRIDAVRQAPR
jgi:hypothetical protein